jgi:thiamine-phosphate pyrophosphorylase
MVVTDRRRAPDVPLSELARRAARAGVDFLQVREKDLGDAALLLVAAEVVAAARGAGSGLRVLVNGRPDVAEAAGAHGVQLPEEGLPVEEVRRAFPRLVIGASCHSAPAAARAAAAGADLVVFGPVFATPGKEGRAAGGEALAEVAAATRVPVFAIGGVTAAEVGAVREAGAAGIAAIRPFLEGDVQRAATEYRRAWEAAGSRP